MESSSSQQLPPGPVSARSSSSDDDYVRTRCDRCIRDKLKCTVQKPCTPCMDGREICTTNGGKPVEGAKKTSKRKTLDPGSDISPNASRLKKLMNKTAEPSTLPESCKGLLQELSGEVGPSSEGRRTFRSPSIPLAERITSPNSISRAFLEKQAVTALFASAAEPCSSIPRSPRSDNRPRSPDVTKTKSDPARREEAKSLGKITKNLQSPNGKFIQIVDATRVTLAILRTYHFKHQESNLGLGELHALLTSAGYSLRKIPKWAVELQDLPWDWSPGEMEAYKEEMSVVSNRGEETHIGTGSTAQEARARSKQREPADVSAGPSTITTRERDRTVKPLPRFPWDKRSNYCRVVAATSKLDAWIQESETIMEALFVLRGLEAVAAELEIAGLLEQWMISDP